MTTELFAGMPVRDSAAATAWYERLLGAAPTYVPDDTEAVWELAEPVPASVRRSSATRTATR